MQQIKPIAFIHIEKAAGITINRILRRSFGVNHFDVEPWNKHNDFFTYQGLCRLQKIYPNLISIAGHSVKPFSDLENKVRYFTFLRDPITRCASHYQFQVQAMGKRISFEDWICNEQYHNFQTKKIAGKAKLQSAISIIEKSSIFVGLIENFDESIIMLQNFFQEPRLKIEYRKENVAVNSSIKNNLLHSPISREKLENINVVDNELYKYIKEHIYPKQKHKYGNGLDASLSTFKRGNNPPKFSTNYTLNFLNRNLIYKPIINLYRLLSHNLKY